MKGKEKGTIYAVLIMLLVACLLTGCKEKDEAPPVSSVGEMAVETGVQSEAVTSQSSTGNTTGRIEPANVGEMIEALDEQECPEGYVYDYQVSMEPIPEEIAALGGPCQGTIHAFPSKIGMALTELEMEKDPVLKAEVEKRIPEIEAALEEEIGGDFTVDGVILNTDLGWVFFCTEIGTDYQFDLYYANKEYHAKVNNTTSSENVISVEDYYKKKRSMDLQEELNFIVGEIYKSGNIKVQMQSSTDVIEIIIAQYAEEDVDKCLQQEKLLLLWEKLMAYDKEVHYNISLTFYPYEYKTIIDEKFKTNIRYDFGTVFNEKAVRHLGNNLEILCCFRYVGISDDKDDENINVLLQQSKEENYNKKKIWEYWIY